MATGQVPLEWFQFVLSRGEHWRRFRAMKRKNPQNRMQEGGPGLPRTGLAAAWAPVRFSICVARGCAGVLVIIFIKRIS